jgi:hydrogenase maturation protease
LVDVAPHQLLEDGQPVQTCRVLVLGCGNILRGDDAVGPILVRHLWARGIPDGVRLVDGGTAGMDVAFAMRGAARVVLVDASRTGAEPGTIYRVPGAELEQLPELTGLHTHSFRWDHALAFSRWLLGPHVPTDITVFLIEAGSFGPGEPLSPVVDAAMRRVGSLIAAEFFDEDCSFVQVTADGYLQLRAQLADLRFGTGVCGARRDGDRLALVPLAGAANGGFLLRRRNRVGDCSLLVRELIGDDLSPGRYPVLWDEAAGELQIMLDVHYVEDDS